MQTIEQYSTTYRIHCAIPRRNSSDTYKNKTVCVLFAREMAGREVSMKKVLFVGSDITDISNKFQAHLAFFKRNGYSVHLLGEDTGIDIDNVDQIIDFNFFEKNSFKSEHKQIKQLQTLLLDENYTVVICYQDIPGYFVRMAGRNSFRKFTRPKMFYIATEYPFYENPNGQTEKKCFDRQKKAGKTTDLLIVTNDTDLYIAEKFNFSTDTIVKLYGIGVASIADRVKSVDPQAVRMQYSLNEEYLIGLYDNCYEEDKNHRFLIENLLPIINRFPHFKLICNGRGKELENLRQLAESEGVAKNILFLEKEDPAELYAISDLYISPSLIEGIPEGIIHALECHIPILASRIKGNVDIIEDGKNGILFDLNNYADFIANLYVLLEKKDLRNRLKRQTTASIENYFSDGAQKHIFNYYRKMIADDHDEVLGNTSNFNDEAKEA